MLFFVQLLKDVVLLWLVCLIVVLVKVMQLMLPSGFSKLVELIWLE